MEARFVIKSDTLSLQNLPMCSLQMFSLIKCDNQSLEGDSMRKNQGNQNQQSEVVSPESNPLADLASPTEGCRKAPLKAQLAARSQKRGLATQKQESEQQAAQQQKELGQGPGIVTQNQTADELEGLISQFVSPISKSIYIEYDPGLKNRKKEAQSPENEAKSMKKESCLEHEEAAMKGHVYMELSIHIYQSIDFLQKLEIPIEEVKKREVEITWTKPHCTKLLLLDLDETLAHCVKNPNPEREPQVYLNITTPKGQTCRAGFNIRPYCKQLLEKANQHYEVAVFTASTSVYADTVLNYLDPDKTLIQHRFYRQSCVRAPDGEYIKDLRIFKNVSLKNMLLVDNAVWSFGLQLSNGIPIPSFKEDPEDVEFIHLMRYLEKCAQVEDVREVNKKAFGLAEMFKHPFDSFVDYYYDLEDCEQLMAEERENDYFTRKQRSISIGARRAVRPPPKSVDECLDGLSELLKEGGGRLIKQ